LNHRGAEAQREAGGNAKTPRAPREAGRQVGRVVGTGTLPWGRRGAQISQTTQIGGLAAASGYWPTANGERLIAVEPQIEQMTQMGETRGQWSEGSVEPQRRGGAEGGRWNRQEAESAKEGR
jgi:hypothetical protein